MSVIKGQGPQNQLTKMGITRKNYVRICDFSMAPSGYGGGMMDSRGPMEPRSLMDTRGPMDMDTMSDNSRQQVTTVKPLKLWTLKY